MAKQSQETTNAETSYKLHSVIDDLKDLSTKVDGLYIIFVTKEEFLLVRNIVFGLVGLILLAFAQAVISGHIR